jgi:hypothetical protein
MTPSLSSQESVWPLNWFIFYLYLSDPVTEKIGEFTNLRIFELKFVNPQVRQYFNPPAGARS